jgi:hypothetical protein
MSDRIVPFALAPPVAYTLVRRGNEEEMAGVAGREGVLESSRIAEERDR